MKSLSLAKPLIIVMVGLPGAGKSFFARQFSETFSAPVISLDRLNHIVSETVHDPSLAEKTVGNIVDYQLEELLRTQKTFLLDGAANTKTERVELRKQARTAGYDVLLVWIQTDNPTARFRSMKRSNRRLDDRFSPSLNAHEYEQLSKHFSTPAPNEQYVVVSGKHTYASQAKVVLKKIVTPRQTQTIVGHEGRPPATDSTRQSRGILVR